MIAYVIIFVIFFTLECGAIGLSLSAILYCLNGEDKEADKASRNSLILFLLCIVCVIIAVIYRETRGGI